MKKVLYLSLICIISGCQTKEEKLHKSITNNTRLFIESELKNRAENGNIQELKFIKSDSLTELDESLMYSNYISKKVRNLLAIAETHQETARLYSGINSNLLQLEKEAAQKLLDSAQILLITSQKIAERLPKLDTLKPLYFKSKIFLRLKKSNGSLNEDTLDVTSDLNGNLITTPEAIKRVSKKYY